jgi:hypothetical protein
MKRTLAVCLVLVLLGAVLTVVGPATAGPPDGPALYTVRVPGIRAPFILSGVTGLNGAKTANARELDALKKKKPATAKKRVVLRRVPAGDDGLRAWYELVKHGTSDRRHVDIQVRTGQSAVRKYILINAYPDTWKISDADIESLNPGTEEISLAVEQVLQLE